MKLNIACATNLFQGWVNIDRVDMTSYLQHMNGPSEDILKTWPVAQAALSRAVTAGLIDFELQDLRQGFPHYEAGSVDAIYLGQVVEHLNPLQELPKFLLECFRLLKSGGKVRITTPDLDVLLRAYQDGRLSEFNAEQPAFYWDALPSAQLSYLMFGACGPDSTLENYEGHSSCLSQEWLQQLLERAGFSSVTFGVKSEEFSGCVDCGMSHSMGAEATKP